MGVCRENIELAYDAVIKRYGSFEKYVLEEYGVAPLDIAIIRVNYLEPIA